MNIIDMIRIGEMFEKIIAILERIEARDDGKKKIVHPLDGDELLDSQDLCLLLKITKRSLAEYRKKKLIPYYKIDRKTYYKASEIQSFLKKKGKL